jgi:sortase A
MFKIGVRTKQPAGQAAPSPQAVDRKYINVEAKARVHKRGSIMHVAGNLLIGVGLLMLLGIGGWLGYREWDNQQYLQNARAEFGTGFQFEPAAMDSPTPAPTPPPPLPILTKDGTGLVGILNKLPKEEDTSPPVRLSIPSVKIDSKIVPVSWKMIPAPGGALTSEWQVADYAVGHHAGTANPGQPGNVVLSGHVDYRGQVFKDLNKVHKGDEVTVYTEKGQYIYVVTDLVIVKEEGVSDAQKRQNAAYMNPTPDKTLTMITCWPYGVDDHRLVVISKPYQSTLSAESEFTIR